MNHLRLDLTKALFSCAFLSLLFLIIHSCRHEDVQITNTFTVTEAQRWFESNSYSSSKLKSGQNIESLEIKYNWEKAKSFNKDSVCSVEVDIISKGKFFYLYNLSRNAMDSTGNKKYTNSYSKLVICKNLKSNKIYGFTMTIIGKPNYMEKHNFDLTNIKYLKWSKDLSGSILYHNLDGKFINGWNFENGKINAIISSIPKKSISSTLKSAKQSDCMAVTVTLYNQFCTDWYVNGEYSYTTCEDRTSEYEEYYLYCAYEPYEGSGGGNGGYAGDEPNEPNADIRSDFSGYPCGEAALQALASSNTKICDILYNTFGFSANVNISFLHSQLPPDVDGIKNGRLCSPNNSVIEISEFVLLNSSQPYILATLAHEGLHGYFDYLKDHDPNFAAKYPILNKNDKGELIYMASSDREHEYMTKYVNDIADLIVQAYPNVSKTVALELSWGGLQNTHAYKLNKESLDKIIPNSFQNNVANTNRYHRTSGCNNY